MGPKVVAIRLCFGSEGVLRSAEAQGHAGTSPRGDNPACAAVTVLLRTAYETASSYDGVVAHGKAESSGSLGFEIGRYPPEAAERLKGIGDFLLIGLSGVEREYPGLIDMKLDNERRN